MTFQQVHPGGYFWSLDRIDREHAILRLATEVDQLVVIARADAIAADLGERLGLSGLPVVVGTTGTGDHALESFLTDGVSTLVASDSYLHENRPFHAALVVHARVAPTSKQYNRRLSTVTAPVHVSVIVPEDVKSAKLLVDHLQETDVIELNDDEAIGTVIDLTTRSDPAHVRHRHRRRFPLPR